MGAINRGRRKAGPHLVFSIRYRTILLFAAALSLVFCVSCKPGADETASESKYLSASKQWDKKILSQLENTEADLTTSWKEGRLHYVLYVSPYNGSFDRYIKDTLADNKLSIHLEDMGGLNLLDIDVPVSKMTSVAEGKSERLPLRMDGDIRCTKQIYKAVTDWSVTCSFPLKH